MTSTSDGHPISTSPVITDPGHGESFTQHMISMDWSEDGGWSDLRVSPLDHLSIHPGMIGLHYGQVIFEGLKAHRRTDGSMVVFRPWDHARRFQSSARRLAMPELPENLFVEAIDRLVSLDEAVLSTDPSHSLYLRPFMFATDVSLMLRPSRTYRFLLMAFVAGGFFGEGVDTISAYVGRDYARAYPKGTGDVKIAGNYAPSFLAQRQAEEAGCQQVVWLDAAEGRYVEEMGGMNMFFVRGEGPEAEVITPELTGTLLPGVTRRTLLSLAERFGYTTKEEHITVDRWREECENNTITEVFACGTAAVVTAVGHVRDGSAGWKVGDGLPGPVTRTLRKALVDLHHGELSDTEGWLYPCGSGS